MIKRLGIIALTLMFVVTFVGFVFASDDQDIDAFWIDAEKLGLKHTGTITDIDKKANTITIKEESGEVSKVMGVDMKRVDKLNLKKGDLVECKFTKDAKNVCTYGGIRKAPAEKPKSKKG